MSVFDKLQESVKQPVYSIVFYTKKCSKYLKYP